MITCYCSHSSLTLAVKLRKNVMQEMVFASQSEFTCKIFSLQKSYVAENVVNSNDNINAAYILFTCVQTPLIYSKIAEYITKVNGVTYHYESLK